MQPLKKLVIGAWCLYDWASAAFSIIVITFIFSTYFTTHVASNQIIGTYQWANATALAGILIAFLSPIMGSIADHGGHHKRWLWFFTSIAIICSALLWFAYPNPSRVYFTLSIIVIGTIAYEVAQVFYNVFLTTLAPSTYLGRISGWGWGAGYIGGIVALSIALTCFIQSPFFPLPTTDAAPIRICGPFVALWMLLFSLPFFFLAQDLPARAPSLSMAVRAGCRELFQTLKKLPQEKNIFLYLIAHMFYTDGLNTLFAFGGIYAAGTFGLSFEEVLIFGITMNITAGVGAILLAWMDDYLGSKRTISFSLLCLMLLGIPLLLIKQKYLFWLVALGLCLFVGPIQSASRSLMARLIVGKAASGEMFGLYALSGKVTAFMGPWLLGELTLLFASQRAGMSVILIFCGIGALLLWPVCEPAHETKSS